VSRRSYADVEIDVIRWAEARQIIPNSSPLAQATKTLEEAGELLEAAAQMKILKKLLERTDLQMVHKQYEWTLERFRDAAGDVLVTLINACALADVDLVDCLCDAYEEIKDRKGTMNAAGVFVKETT